MGKSLIFFRERLQCVTTCDAKPLSFIFFGPSICASFFGFMTGSPPLFIVWGYLSSSEMSQ
jgi:hypothetical protein